MENIIKKRYFYGKMLKLVSWRTFPNYFCNTLNIKSFGCMFARF